MSGTNVWSDTWYDISVLAKNAWNTVTTTIPGNTVLPLNGIGVKIVGNAYASVYIDSVSW